MDDILAELRRLSRRTSLFLLVTMAVVAVVGAYVGRKSLPPQPTPLPPEPDAIGGVVYCDKDSNGLPNSGDSGVPSVTVELWIPGGPAPLSVDSTESTGVHRGAYQFPMVAPGTYEIRVQEPTLAASLQPPGRTQPPSGSAWPQVTMVSKLALVGPHFGYHLSSPTVSCP